MKRFWRTAECLLALAWPIVAYNVAFKRYGWSSQYYDKWGEIWFAFVLAIPMVGPVLAKLFSSNALDTQKRFTLIGLMTWELPWRLSFALLWAVFPSWVSFCRWPSRLS